MPMTPISAAASCFNLRDRDSLEEAISHLQRSLRFDDSFAPAHAQFAIATYLLARQDWTDARSVTIEVAGRKAKKLLDRAEQLEPGLAEIYAGRALLENYDNPEAAMELSRKALAVNPSYVDAMNWLRIAYGNLGRYEEATALFQRMLAIDPLNMTARREYVMNLGYRGLTEEAHERADELLTDYPRWRYWVHANLSRNFEGRIAEGLFWVLHSLAEYPDLNLYPLETGFTWIGEYDEARRIVGALVYQIDIAEGRFDDAFAATQERLELYPDSPEAIEAAAHTLYVTGQVVEALPLYEQLLGLTPGKRSIWSFELDIDENESIMRLALARRRVGDEEGAQAAAELARQNHAKRLELGVRHPTEHRVNALIAAFDDDPDRAIESLRAAVRQGLRDAQIFHDPAFESLQKDSRFIAVRQELEALLDAEHHKVLQLICVNNPAPGEWRPLPETCAAVNQ